ncbi:MAG: PKD domain-containing protein, partial [Methanosarcina thermophila]|nr:PKD domain-containing protein [Methanosarcina thermophila]
GDGASSTEQNPSHTYSTAGTYTVTLEASNANGTDSKSSTITVLRQPVPPVADFSSSVTEGYAPLTVQFTDLSQNAAEWSWDFGDGASSSEQSPSHTYSAAGSYTVTLTVSNADGTDSKTGGISVAEKPADNSSNDTAADSSGDSSSTGSSGNDGSEDSSGNDGSEDSSGNDGSEDSSGNDSFEDSSGNESSA